MNFYTIHTLLNTIQSDVPSNQGLYDTDKKPKAISATMDSGFCGPSITTLPESVEYDVIQICSYISIVLELLKQDGAYGIFVGVRSNNGPVVPTFVIGVPEGITSMTELPTPPQDLPIWIKEDKFILIPGVGEKWALTPVSDPEKLTLDSVSIGIEGSLKGAGSFCGFVKKPSSPGNIYGMTAAHCLPQGGTGMPVCIPSTIEVSSRFTRLLRYTTLCPEQDRLHFTRGKQTELESILQKYKFNANPEGPAFLDPLCSDQIKQGVLSGAVIGQIASYDFGHYSGLLYAYDQMLQRDGMGRFFAGRLWESRMDWAIFSCHNDRYGGNVCQEEIVSEIGHLYPYAEVEKMGRSTGLQCGKVNPIILQRWECGRITYEIPIIGKDEGFAAIGDSGACVMVNENGKYRAAGILIGKTRYTGIAVATPLAMILSSASDYVWA